MAEELPPGEHVLIGGAFDGRLVNIEPGAEYVAYPIRQPISMVPPPRPVAVDFKKAIYTRRRIWPDRFAPLVYYAAVELTDREAMALLLKGYSKQ
jgi:hypothetical protein